MPRPQVDVDHFKADILLQIAGGDFKKDLRQWLAVNGLKISKNTLSMRTRVARETHAGTKRRPSLVI
jgi:hypothetical protein